MKMKKAFHRFAPNLETRGRILRGGGAGLMAAAAAITWPRSVAVAAGFVVASSFLTFEAVRGWCVFRACGVKTKL
jgi:hypothetical protein